MTFAFDRNGQDPMILLSRLGSSSYVRTTSISEFAAPPRKAEKLMSKMATFVRRFMERKII